MGDEENTEGTIGAVRTAVSTAAEIIKVAKENPDAVQAGQTAAKTLSVLSSSLYNMLMPLRVLNFAAEKVEGYFAKKFGEELGGRLADAPPEEVIEPKSFIAGPAIQGIADTVDEPDLRKMYLSLLARAMRKDTAETAHPSFAEIVKQLSPDEARIIGHLLTTPVTAVVTIRGKLERGYVQYERHIIPIFGYSEPYSPDVASEGARYIDNWQRLGLIEIDYQESLVAEDAYAWVESRPEYLHRAEVLPPDQTISFGKGIVNTTDFGRAFAAAVGILEVEQATS